MRRRLDILQQATRTIWGTLDVELVLKHIIEVTKEVAEADAVLLYLLDPDGEHLVLRASSAAHPDLVGNLRLKVGEGVTGWAARAKEPVAIAEHARKDKRFKFFPGLPEDESEAFLAVPILRRGKLVGVVNSHRRRAHAWDADTIDLIATITQQVGGAIENALLYEETRKRAEQLDMISKLSGAVVSGSYLDEILQLIVSLTANQMRSRICSLMLLNEEAGELVIAATQSLSEGYRNKPPIKVGQSISGLAVRDRKPLVVSDVQADARYAYPDVAKAEGLRSLLCVPMMIQDRSLGVLNVYTTELRRFSAEDVQLLQTIANQAAVAIQNTRLLTETLKMREALESRKIIERAKGILQREMGLTEDKAFRLLQKKSMDSCKPMKEIAEAIILSAEMRGGK
ncbi:MAG: GAF domain-containing protein [Candidatus Coatesbacteria bacterium]